MIYLIALAIIVLLAIVLIQIGRISDLSDRIKGEEVAELDNNTTQGKAMVAFMVAFLVFCIWSAWHYKNVMFGFGPLTSASEHGFELDWIFLITLIFTGIVFVITHILLFWYSYRYRKVKGSTAKFFAHDTKLEMIWTAIPAVVMTILVANGLVAWNRIFKPIGPDQNVLNIEATGYQFAWDIRYPCPDGKLGNKDYRNIIPGVNDLGLDWNDEAALDDIILAGSDK
ncbi:MAG: flagellar motor protein MotB, partial [Saprospiraceae bacterium]|nr:flagellar motor protein MotB [Saprospiraceae bacterium]